MPLKQSVRCSSLLSFSPSPCKLRPTRWIRRQRSSRPQDQALLDAVAPGDRSVWEQALAPDAVYVDEAGAVMNRAQFLEQLTPLPAGASGNLHITSYTAHIAGDLATVIHVDDEVENCRTADTERALPDDRDLATRRWRVEALPG